MEFEGSCHCGNIRMLFTSMISPDEIVVRACQCSFCRKHNTLAVADPEGSLKVEFRSEIDVNKYRFGLETAEYLICRQCGVYGAAVTVEVPKRALVIVNALDDRARFTRPPKVNVYDNESSDDRRNRRARTWIPYSAE